MTKKTEIHWKTDAEGMLLGARAHDGTIADLNYSKNLLSFRVQRLAGDFVWFELAGVTKLNLSLWEGTILAEVFAWKLGSFIDLTSICANQAWDFLYRQRVHDLKTEIDQTVKKKPESFLVHMLSSYGGEIAVICNRVAVYEER